ncbi:MAG: SBBP repeat-containing protein, partial [Candidatus Binatia bacterium]
MSEGRARRSSVLLFAGFVAGGVSSCNEVLTFSTFLGGSASEGVRDVAVDAVGNLYVAGGTESANFPVTAGAFQTTHNPGTPESPAVTRNDVFVAKFDPTGRQLIWSTFIGGPNHDRAYAIEVDESGFVYVCGRAGRGFPVTAGAFQVS